MGSLFSKPKVPAVPPPAPMPTVGDEAVQRARKNAVAAAQQRGGRASTILTDTANGDKLG